MQIKNTENHYGSIAILLHWTMAVLIIGLLCLGLYMKGLPFSLEKLKFYGWHKEFGITVLILVLMRLIWRLSNIVPVLPTTLPWWENLAARLGHFALYFCMFMMPLTGWMMSSAAGLPVSFFGLFVLPDLLSPNHELKELLGVVHSLIAYGLMGLIFLHAGAALQHHFIYKNNILRRMLP